MSRHPIEDENADPVGDGHSDAEFASASTSLPGRPNPEPDSPVPLLPGDGADDEAEGDDETEPHSPKHPGGPAASWAASAAAQALALH